MIFLPRNIRGIIHLTILTWKKHFSNKTPALTKSTNIDGQLVHLINSLEEVLILKEYFQEDKVVTDQTSLFLYVDCVLPILFVL